MNKPYFARDLGFAITLMRLARIGAGFVQYPG